MSSLCKDWRIAKSFTRFPATGRVVASDREEELKLAEARRLLQLWLSLLTSRMKRESTAVAGENV